MSEEQSSGLEMRQALEELLRLAGITPDEATIESQEVQKAVDTLKVLIHQLRTQPPVQGGDGGVAAPVRQHRGNLVLIAGQLGIVVHQLRQALSKLGANVTICKDMDEAIAEYKSKDYGCLILDLFMPTEREGLIILDEVRKISTVCGIQTNVIVLAPPSRDKNLEDLCRSRGASLFLEKVDKWHEAVLQHVKGESPPAADQE